MVAARHAVYPLHRMVLLASIIGCLTAAIWPMAPAPDFTPIPETSPADPPSGKDPKTSAAAGLRPAARRLATSPGA